MKLFFSSLSLQVDIFIKRSSTIYYILLLVITLHIYLKKKIFPLYQQRNRKCVFVNKTESFSIRIQFDLNTSRKTDKHWASSSYNHLVLPPDTGGLQQVSLASHQKGAGLVGGRCSRMLRGNPPSHPATDTHRRTPHASLDSVGSSSVLWLCTLPVFLPLWDADRCSVMEHMSSPVRFRANKKGRQPPACEHNGVAADECSLLHNV